MYTKNKEVSKHWDINLNNLSDEKIDIFLEFAKNNNMLTNISFVKKKRK